MCLILFAHRAHAAYPLVVAANRDEFFARPTTPADYWPDAPDVLGGRDLEKGGTWMSVARDGRWAAVTNVRDGTKAGRGARSRGELVADFLLDSVQPGIYVASAQRSKQGFAGFNLLIGDQQELHYLSSEDAIPRALAPGIYGLSNGALDSPWPKVERGKIALRQALASASGPDKLIETLLAALADRRVAEDEALPRTGIAPDLERRLSAAFISTPGYGTRSSTILLVAQDGEAHFRERSFGERGELIEDRRFRFVPRDSRATTSD